MALCRIGAQIQADQVYGEGDPIREAGFQTYLLQRLRLVQELGGRIVEGAEVAGGETDLQHDGIIAELKVERRRPVTPENAYEYLGQPQQYAAGAAQLSLLVILDMTPKQAPPGALINYVDIVEPSVHGLTDPAYPSRVGVVIINGNLPKPSDWAGRRIGLREGGAIDAHREDAGHSAAQ